MKLIKADYKCRCDINNCRNYADYVISGESVLPERRIKICEKCAEELRKALNAALGKKGGEK